MNHEQIVKQAQQGDRDALIHLLKDMELLLYGLARSIVKKDEDCADALQEAMLKAYKSIHTLKEPVYFKTWMSRIQINECNAILRKRAKSFAVSDFSNLTATSTEYEHVELREAVDHLDEGQRTVVILHYFQDMPLKQIAEILDISEGAVKTRLHRARQKLAQYLEKGSERKIAYGSV